MDMLPSFNAKNRAEYARWQSGIAEARELKALAAGNPQDEAVLDGWASRMESGLARKKWADGLETAGIVSAQIGACGFFPVLLMGQQALALGAAGAIFGGMGLIVGGILLAKGYPQKSMLKSPNLFQDAQVLQRYQKKRADLAEAQARIGQRVEEFRGVLDRATKPPEDRPTITQDPGVVRIGGVVIPVRP